MKAVLGSGAATGVFRDPHYLVSLPRHILSQNMAKETRLKEKAAGQPCSRAAQWGKGTKMAVLPKHTVGAAIK